MKLIPLLALSLIAAPAAAQVTLEQVRAEIGKALAPQAPSRSMSNLSAFNPAIGLVLDAVGQHTTLGDSTFRFRTAEMNFEAASDPFGKLYAVINATPNGVEAEEVAFVTTALPHNLTVRGGRFFANVARLPRWHDHELPFVERTTSLDTFFNGEAQTDGLELMHLFRVPFFLQGTLGAGNKLGAENARLDETAGAGHAAGRPLAAFTYNARLFTYAPLSDNFGLDFGLSESLTPRQYYVGGVRSNNVSNARSLTAADATLRWEPLGDNVRKALWGTEVFRNSERRRAAVIDEAGGAILDAAGNPLFSNARVNAWGGVSYLEARLSSRWSAGAFVDYAEDIDLKRRNTRTAGLTTTFHVSDFQNVRVQLSRKRDNFGGKADSQVFVQYRASIGSHVHAFKNR